MTDHPIPLTEQQFADIEARATSEHLTRGPWDLAYESCDCGGDYPCGHGPFVTGVVTLVPTSMAADRCKRTGEEPRDYDFHRGEIGDFSEADWVLMVAAREDVPALLAEVRRLRAAVTAAATVRARHKRRTERHGSGCVQCGIVWPCPTYLGLAAVGESAAEATL